MSAARWAIRSELYWLGPTVAGWPQWISDKDRRREFDSAKAARQFRHDTAKAHPRYTGYADAKIVRLLTPAESRRKAAATALREFATHLRGIANVHSHVERKRALEWSAKQAESRADALWPRKGAGR